MALPLARTQDSGQNDVESAAADSGSRAIPEPRTPAKPTHFVFEHRVFQIKDTWFGLSEASGEASYHVMLGDVPASVPIDKVTSTFGISKASTDFELLQTVKRGLRFVKEIRPGDSVPEEILTGTASWKVEPGHHEIARARITMQLVAWMSGKPFESIDAAELEALASLPETKKRVQEAFEVMAEKLGIGRDKKEEVVGRIEELARELSYIEALRDRFSKIKKLHGAIPTLQVVYKGERSIWEELQRIRILLKMPVAEIMTLFEQIDGNTGEILNVLKKMQAQIQYIRNARDDLNHRFMKWDGLLAEWEGVPLDRSSQMDTLVKKTYRFVARHFPQATAWSLQSR